MKSARFLVLELLLKMEANAYSNITLDHALSDSGLDTQDKKFASSLFYGVIERKITLDSLIGIHSAKPVDKISGEILQILRMGIYQLKYMSSVPDSAAVNESVALTKQIRMVSASGFVNAILRNFIRSGKELLLPQDPIRALSIEYSCPEWLVEKWDREYGQKNIRGLLENTVSQPPTYIRVNTLKITDEKLMDMLKDENITAFPTKLPHCLEVENFRQDSTAFQQGFYHVQDFSSQLCCEALAPKEGEILVDLCAAPGGKTYTLSQLMKDRGTIYAYDLHEKRVLLIKNGARRLSLSSINTLCGDAKQFNPEVPKVDKVLCDVPCAGLGVIAKKPEIKYKNPVDLAGLPDIQYAILENAAKYLKPGGELIYSTCSLSREENDEVVDKFLRLHEEYEGISFLNAWGDPFGSYKATILPEHFQSDGFFIAKLVRKK